MHIYEVITPNVAHIRQTQRVTSATKRSTMKKAANAIAIINDIDKSGMQVRILL